MHVIMLHSIGNDQSKWSRHWLSASLVHFETLCEFISKKGYTTHTLDEWYDYFSVTRKKDHKKLVLTFDDGYLDNWVYVFPLLKKYGLKGTVFINPEFVDPGKLIRPNLIDASEGSMNLSELQTIGFLNWPEIQAMQSSGVIDIQSHSMSHNFQFCSGKIVDIYSGQPKYDWIPWLTHPEQKPFYISEDQSGLVPFGYPVFEFGRALGLRRYFPDEQVISESIELFSKGKKDRQTTIGELMVLLERFPGRFENDHDMEVRYKYELFESKRILEEKLNKKVEFLCWPGGGYNKLSITLSQEAGYKASTLGSAERTQWTGIEEKYKRIPRFGLGSFISLKSRFYYVSNPEHLIYMLKSRTGNIFFRILQKCKKEVIQKLNK